MGSKVSVPKPSAEEKLLQKNQAELLALQREIIEDTRAQNAVLVPFLAEQEGFDVETDAQGNITKISKRPDPQEDKRKEVESLLLDRSLAALKGELPVDPGLEEGLTQQEQQLRDRLSSQLGPGYETSTAGIQTMGEFFRTSEILREGARTGQLTLAEQLGITREQQNQATRAGQQDVLRQSSIGDPLTFAGAFGQTARGFGQAQVPFIQQRQMELDASKANAANSTAMFGAGIGLVGALFSDDDLKYNLVQIGETPNHALPIYMYTRRDNEETQIGLMASDVERVKPGNIGMRDGFRVVQYEGL